jgi:hypothetical protein
MGSTWGNQLKISVFGESHGKGVGIVIDGLIERIAWTALVWWGVLNLIAVPVATAIAYLYTIPRRRANGWLPSNGVGRLDRER